MNVYRVFNREGQLHPFSILFLALKLAGLPLAKLEEHGIQEMPETVDEFEQVLLAFRDNASKLH